MTVGPELLDLLMNLRRRETRSMDEIHRRVGGSKSTVHHRLTRLVEQGLVKHIDRVGYTLEDAGVAERKAAKEGKKAVAWPQLPLPKEIRTLPAVHQAVIELALCAAAGRYHRVFTDAIASFLLFGKGLKLKTLVMKIVTVLAGGYPKRHVLRMFKESAATATIRRNHQGIATVRGAARAPIVGLDEFARAPAEVRNAPLIYTFGEAEFPESDDSMLEVLATPILALNPPEKLETVDITTVNLTEFTGFDGAVRRRMLLSDLSMVEIPAALQGRGGKKLFEAVVKAGPYKLPRPVFPDHVPDEVVRNGLLAIFDSAKRIDQTDVLMIAQLVAGATAFELDKDAAVRNVLRNVATCNETMGWLKPDWRLRLAEFLGAPTDVDSEEEPSTRVVVNAPNQEDVAGLTEVNAYARKQGLSWDVVMKRVSLPEDLAARGVDLEQAVRSQAFLAERKLEDLRKLESVIEKGREVDRLRLSAGDVIAIGQALGLDLDPQLSVEEAYEYLLRVLGKHASVEDATAAARERHERQLVSQARELEEVRALVLGQRELLKDYEWMLNGVRKAVADARTGRARGRSSRSSIACGRTATSAGSRRTSSS